MPLQGKGRIVGSVRDSLLETGMHRFTHWISCLLLGIVFLVVACEKESPVADPVAPKPSAPEASSALGEIPQPHGLSRHARLADELALVDPTVAGWESEAFTETVTQLMKKGVAATLIGDQDKAHAALAKMIGKNVAFTPLRPTERQVIHTSHAITITEATASELPSTTGKEAFLAALQLLAKPLQGATDKQAKFKVMHVEDKGDTQEARLLFEWRGRLPSGWGQITSTWHTDWSKTESPQLLGLRVYQHREAFPAEGQLDFEDIAPRVLAGESAYAEHLVYSFDHWRSRTDRNLVADLLGAQGVVVGDVNGDLLDDVYVLQPGGLPNRLFLHQDDGTAKDVAEEAGVAILDFCRSALLVDLDNDDDNDLVVALAWTVVLFENDGSGTFAQREAIASQGQINSMAAADYNGDRLLDLYICGRDASGALKAEQGALGIPMPYYDANNGGPNMLLRNDGSFKLRDVTKEVGMNANNSRFSLACAWEDFDNDGDQDLYVSNDFGRNNLFRNDGGRFTDIAVEAGVVDIGPGMSAAWGDHNADGLMDLYIGNMWSNAGNRITLQETFLPEASKEAKAQARRHARGNSVYVNEGDGTFYDATHTSGANMARWAWSSNFIDFNNDGLEDLIVANGMITTDDTGDL